MQYHTHTEQKHVVERIEKVYSDTGLILAPYEVEFKIFLDSYCLSCGEKVFTTMLKDN